ncbi:MAG: ribose 5-phosphate isomerase B [Spirochaetes bacterium]|jgi:ribose 5-phosphate isomerase B|nr:ribose 5-phosphate isomerase B [Spirochaetota bacterium]
MKISIGSDHAGLRLKRFLIDKFKDRGLEFIDVGTHTEESCDYPDFASAAAGKVRDGAADKGIVICGSGIGVSIAANKIKGIRAALCFNEYMAEMSRRHNDANVLALGARVIGDDLAAAIVDRWISTGFEGGRHQKRLDKISALE